MIRTRVIRIVPMNLPARFAAGNPVMRSIASTVAFIYNRLNA